jgi:hypothetical protein
MATAAFNSKDQDWNNESTTYWFEISGTDYGTGVDFEEYAGELFGICESGPEMKVLDNDGAPLTGSDALAIAVTSCAMVTDGMRAE